MKKMIPIPIPDRSLQSLGTFPPQSITAFQGESTLDKFSIAKTIATRTKNITGKAFPTMSVRDGYTQQSTTLPGRITGLVSWKDTELQAIANGNWYKMLSGAWSSISSGLNTTAMWSMCNFQGNFTGTNVLASNGVDPVKKYDGTTVSNLLNAPAGMNYITQHDNRVYGAIGQKVSFSALRKAEDWTTVDDAGEIVVETGGSTITGLIAGSRHLMVFKNNSLHELWGTNPANYKMDMIASDIGIVSHQAGVTIEDTPYWLDMYGIYMYGGSRPRKDFSLPMKGYIERMNRANMQKASAGTDGKNLFISLPLDSSTECDTTLVFNREFNIWTVYKDITPTIYAFMNGTMHTGTTAGNVIKWDGNVADNGSLVNWEWVSAPFGGHSNAQKIQWYRMWFVANVPVGSSMSVFVSKSAEGDSDWTLIQSISPNGLQSGRMILPIASLANANWMRVRFAGSGPCTVNSIDIQQRELPMY